VTHQSADLPQNIGNYSPTGAWQKAGRISLTSSTPLLGHLSPTTVEKGVRAKMTAALCTECRKRHAAEGVVAAEVGSGA
jgi:hypothetical protein